LVVNGLDRKGISLTIVGSGTGIDNQFGDSSVAT